MRIECIVSEQCGGNDSPNQAFPWFKCITSTMKQKPKECFDGPTHGEGITKRNCNRCQAFRARLWRKTPKGKAATKKRNKELKKHPGYRAKIAVCLAVRKGILIRIGAHVCVDCGAEAQAYDHRDYRKPLEVEPVCFKCNARRGPAAF